MSARQAPDRIYAELFETVQTRHLFPDSKTFVDATAREDPHRILSAFRESIEQDDFDLEEFVHAHFELPPALADTSAAPRDMVVEDRIEELWDVLTRAADEDVPYSSLIPLPNPYVVPGGRFREVYYWDSFFTMLGLAESGRVDLIKDMVENFAFLIDDIGFVPNGNRTYYCTRSQPPFFALMVELLSESRDEPGILARFLPQMIREYEFWMDGTDQVGGSAPTHRRIVTAGDAFLNRYWDDAATPRPESYAEDVQVAADADRDPAEVYRDIRAGAESGWDFSSRWFSDGRSMATIRTTSILPVDLNALLYKVETTLSEVCQSEGDNDRARLYRLRAEQRRHLLQTLFFDEEAGMFVDLHVADRTPTGVLSIAAAYPLFFGIATPDQAARVAARIHADFLFPGGWVTTLHETGQQWDRPNGWAPMQWITYCGLRQYGFDTEARTGAERWVDDNIAVFRKHGRLLEKYNVESSGRAGSGGEYSVQDGFGWTNAVLLRLMHRLDS